MEGLRCKLLAQVGLALQGPGCPHRESPLKLSKFSCHHSEIWWVGVLEEGERTKKCAVGFGEVPALWGCRRTPKAPWEESRQVTTTSMGETPALTMYVLLLSVCCRSECQEQSHHPATGVGQPGPGFRKARHNGG